MNLDLMLANSLLILFISASFDLPKNRFSTYCRMIIWWFGKHGKKIGNLKHFTKGKLWHIQLKIHNRVVMEDLNAVTVNSLFHHSLIEPQNHSKAWSSFKSVSPLVKQVK